MSRKIELILITSIEIRESHQDSIIPSKDNKVVTGISLFRVRLYNISNGLNRNNWDITLL